MPTLNQAGTGAPQSWTEAMLETGNTYLPIVSRTHNLTQVLESPSERGLIQRSPLFKKKWSLVTKVVNVLGGDCLFIQQTVMGGMLRAGNTTVNKRDKIPCLMGPTLWRGEQTTNTYRNKTSGLLDSDKVGTG